MDDNPKDYHGLMSAKNKLLLSCSLFLHTAAGSSFKICKIVGIDGK